MIHILHQLPYWTEYLQPLVDGFTFDIVSSKRTNKYPFAPTLPTYDPQVHKQLLCAGSYRRPLDKDTNLLIRFHHSPGIAFDAFVHAYRQIKHSRMHGKCALMIPSNVFISLCTVRTLHKSIARDRDEMVNDSRVLLTEVDVSLNNIYRAVRKVNRVPGTVLLLSNWRICRLQKDFDLIQLEIERLRRIGMNVIFLFHPYSEKLGRNYSKMKDYLTSNSIQFREYLTRGQMVDLFDSVEYAASDGSGSIYEAIARGCKAVSIEGLTYQRPHSYFGPTFDCGYMPSTNLATILSHPGSLKDLEWLKTFHGGNLVDSGRSLVDTMRTEILNYFVKG